MGGVHCEVVSGMIVMEDGRVLGGGDVVAAGVFVGERVNEIVVKVRGSEKEFAETLEGVGVEDLDEAAAHSADDPELGVLMNRHSWKCILLPYTRNQLPAWGKVLKHIGKIDKEHDEKWVGSPTKCIRGIKHKYLMELDLEDWSARKTYFLGEYFELHIMRLLDLMLRPGDRFIDIGSNIGMVALHGAHLVGSGGRVDCFEPNPECCSQIQRLIDKNNLMQIQIHPYGLSDSQEMLELTQEHIHTGGGTFAKLDPSRVVSRVDAEVRRGDDVFVDEMSTCPRLIKIDVEGYELNAMRGMGDTLARWGCPIIMELVEGNLARAGVSVHELVGFMVDLGYTPMNIKFDRKLLGRSLSVEDIANSAQKFSRDVLWTKCPGNPLQ